MADHDREPLHGGCACGAFTFATGKVPTVRFICHCLYCQDFTGQAFSDVSAIAGRHIDLTGTDALTHK